ncbi:MAG: hypothetical protein GTO45_11735 [Candidatus Aminicenantes bacterium]|nr:hypothetical protein [Candidatus Aminicenantes bacterium]NIM79476.1 hypothetical protein [Candidatus Aminicenantes bacterium]NIN18762.1 hypothetical protein [Candidatus Aminicenantes bacterium]NIN42684.1 hypothetical protein [Candidatus Aminicenantes bacterium]NIN85418.1 hypothetical protein [Candidatus Aminicenantes bacterium]
MAENEKLRKDRIDKIIEAIMKFGQGNYSVQVELSDKNDDIDSLAMGLNMMIDDIREAHEEILRNNTILETHPGKGRKGKTGMNMI